ncbi:DNA gyrase inhibitor YacG [Bartonella sp. CB189]|uniref:DNA gyrase inhibitor YacG n=1 Tax=Bartonella sp. CB189 TaxID=3112254 RepID=UPI002F962617
MIEKKQEKSEKIVKSYRQKKISKNQKELNNIIVKSEKMRPAHPCPICGKISQKSTYPFCSTRCKAIDLNRWLSGAYILPASKQKDDEEE